MSSRVRKAGRAWARPALLSILALALATPGIATAESPRPDIIAQAFDDDCGVAALQMLLRAAGVEVSYEELVAGLPATAKDGGLNGADLIAMTRVAGRGLKLEAGFVPLAGLEELTRRESVMILMRPRAIGGPVGFDHFVVIERRLPNGYLVADPVLTKRSVLSDALVVRDAHGKTADGKSYIMVFRLVSDGRGAARALDAEPQDQRVRPWQDLSRLPRPLPAGKWVVSADVAQSESEMALPRLPPIRTTIAAQRLGVERGLGRGQQLSVEVYSSTQAASWLGAGYTLPASRQVVVGVTQFHDWPLPLEVTASTYVAATWSRLGAPAGVEGALRLNRRMGDLSVAFEGRAIANLRDGNVTIVTTPVVSYDAAVKGGFTVSAAASAPVIDFGPTDRLYITAGVSRALTPDLSISAFYQAEVLETSSISERTFGVSLTWGIPRPMRREGR